MLQTALERLKDCDCHTLPVVQDGRLLGIVTADNLAEVLMIQEAMNQARGSRRGVDGAGGRHRNGRHPSLAGAGSFDGHHGDGAASV
jgi:CBS domain-containing protein